MSIRIGNQSAYAAESIVAPFEYAVAQDFNAFEWFPDKKESGEGWDEGDLDKAARKSIQTIAAQRDIRLSVHMPLTWDPLDSRSDSRFYKTTAFAKDLGAHLVNMHFVAAKGLGLFLDAVLPLVAYLAENNIMLSIENTPWTPPEMFNAFFARIRKQRPGIAHRLGMCLDLGHANLCESTRNDYLRFMDLLDPHVPIVHVHMHENYGDHDAHLPLFTGPASHSRTGITGFVKRMKVRNFSGTIILEQWPQPPSLLKEIRDELLQMWMA